MDDVNGGRLIFYDFGMMGRYFSSFHISKLVYHSESFPLLELDGVMIYCI